MFFGKKLIVCFDKVPALHIHTHLFLDQYIYGLYPPPVPKTKRNQPSCKSNHISWLIESNWRTERLVKQLTLSSILWVFSTSQINKLIITKMIHVVSRISLKHCAGLKAEFSLPSDCLESLIILEWIASQRLFSGAWFLHVTAFFCVFASHSLCPKAWPALLKVSLQRKH